MDNPKLSNLSLHVLLNNGLDLEAAKAMSYKELLKLPGAGKKTAREIFNHFHPGKDITDSKTLMTGQEWYDRFCKEVGVISHEQANVFANEPSKLYAYMVEAAKKAAGIE